MTITALCVTISDTGHVNGVLGLAYVLKSRGHKVVFASAKHAYGRLTKLGFEEIVYEEHRGAFGPPPGSRGPPRFRQDFINEKLRHSTGKGPHFERIKKTNKQIEKIIQELKPDVIINDDLWVQPCLATCGIPLVIFESCNPLKGLSEEGLPPATFGLPTQGAEEECERIRKLWLDSIQPQWSSFNEYLLANGAPSLRPGKFRYISTSLNIFMFPKSLAKPYLEKSSLAKYWINIDHSMRPETAGEFKIPETLLKLPGKLLYVSMGTLASNDVHLMKLLVERLSKAKHKFIVSKGKKANEFELAENMWGEAFLPQLDILPHVDAVIGHGGNNSFIETLYFGKPMILIPISGDQPDTAQRAAEAKIAIRFNLFQQSEEELLNAIDFILEDEEMKENIKRVSNEIRVSNSLEFAADRIEKVAQNPQTPTVIEAL